MKRILAVGLALVLVISCLVISASATEITKSSQQIEYLADGSYYVIEIEESNSLARASKTGTKSATYYTSSNVKIFTVQVTGTFSYTYGVSSSATSQSVGVILHHDDAQYVTRSSRRSGATVYGSGTVSYLGYTTSKSVSLTCDIYGNLS